MPSIVPILFALVAIWCAAFIFMHVLIIFASIAWHMAPWLIGLWVLIVIVRRIRA